MSYMITHTFYGFPWNLRAAWQQLVLGSLVNTFNTFTNCFY